MAGSIIEENDQGCATPGFLPQTLLEADLKQALPNTRLNDTLRIGNLIEGGSAPHASIYSVFDEQNSCLAENLEAHAFILDTSQPKIRKHRMRCIKRMEGRTILRKTVHDIEVVVITTSPRPSSGIPDRQDDADKYKDGSDASPAPHTKGHTRQKTPYQREAARIRQRERRNERRLSRRQEHSSEESDDQRGSEVSGRELRLDGDDSEISMDLNLLYIAYDAQGNFRQKITQEHSAYLKAMGPERLHDLLTLYLDEDTLELTAPGDIEAFLRVMKIELNSLRCQQKKMSSTEDYHHDKLLSVTKEQSQHAMGSAEWRRIQEGPRAHALFQLKAVRHAKIVLRVALERLESVYSSITHRLSLVQDIVATEKLCDEWKRLSDDVAKCDMEISMTSPTWSTWEESWRQWCSANKELKSYENDNPGLKSLGDVWVGCLLRMMGTRYGGLNAPEQSFE
ncbi:hypothetical protein VSDG_09734 [Cytospora chrysosperma]|uniref:Uncharacterized protein n=1 Tax=Cytospora chrysosperma TaxID=252740 RepID=A0A423VA17_CYTCH|nr:hypothetical protein VSDG_09734 [Valsa sordida]